MPDGPGRAVPSAVPRDGPLDLRGLARAQGHLQPFPVGDGTLCRELL